mgnify:CR=1 FL=1
MKKNISVIIPVKERFDLLYKALKSINNQTLLPKEVIIIDDFSLSPLKLNLNKTYCLNPATFKKVFSCVLSNSSGDLSSSPS